MANAQSFLVKLLEKNQDEWRSVSINQVAETRSMVLQILQSPQDLQVAAEMHRVGKPAAERLMEVGQQVVPHLHVFFALRIDAPSSARIAPGGPHRQLVE